MLRDAQTMIQYERQPHVLFWTPNSDPSDVFHATSIQYGGCGYKNVAVRSHNCICSALLSFRRRKMSSFLKIFTLVTVLLCFQVR